MNFSKCQMQWMAFTSVQPIKYVETIVISHLKLIKQIQPIFIIIVFSPIFWNSKIIRLNKLTIQLIIWCIFHPNKTFTNKPFSNLSNLTLYLTFYFQKNSIFLFLQTIKHSFIYHIISMKFLLTVGLCAAGTLAFPWNDGSLVWDSQGNQGLGLNNQYSGTGNRWVGTQNRLDGFNNYAQGSRNSIQGWSNVVSGGTNDVSGRDNTVSGSGNRIFGQGNVIQGTGNIVSTNPKDISFDIESRLPAWMRSSTRQTAQSPKIIQQVRPMSPSRVNFDFPTISTSSIQMPMIPPFQVPKSKFETMNYPFSSMNVVPNRASSYSPSRVSYIGFPVQKPQVRQVARSPGRTDIRQVYESPTCHRQVRRSYSTGYDPMSSTYMGRNSQGGSSRYESNLRSQIQNQIQQKLNQAFGRSFY